MNLRTHSSSSSLSSENNHSSYNELPVVLSVHNSIDDIRKQILSISKINKKQRTIVISFLEIFEDVVEQKHLDIETLKSTKSKDNEICIYRKSMDGISMISIDEEGDGFYNFTGYKEGMETLFFENGKPDFETLTYKFFSK